MKCWVLAFVTLQLSQGESTNVQCCAKLNVYLPKLCNQVPSLTLFLQAVVTRHSYMGWFRPWLVGIGLRMSRWRTLTLEKIKISWVLWCIKLQTMRSCWEEYCKSMHSWLLSKVWNFIAPNLSILSTEKIPRILNH